MSDHVRLTISSDRQSDGIVRALVESFSREAGIRPAAVEPLLRAVCGVLGFVSGAVYPDSVGELELTLEREKRALRVQFHDWGRPLPAAGGVFGAVPPALADAARGAVDLRIINLGRDGKLTTFSWPVEPSRAGAPSPPVLAAAAATGPGTSVQPDDSQDVEVREARPENAEGISQLLYDHYALGYVHANFYLPRWVAWQLRSGGLRSSVALSGSDLIGHHALLISPGEAWAESGVAVVHPAYRGLGIFGRLMERTIANASGAGLAAVCGAAVTIHPYSQRAEHAFGYRASALTLGSTPATGPDADRHAQLLSYLMLSSPPRAVNLPTRYREALLDAYANLGLTATDSAMAGGASVDWSEDEERQVAHVKIVGWDGDSEFGFGHGLREMLAGHAEMVFADIDLATTEEIDAVVELLNARGFFYAGLLPCALEGHDALRLQRINTQNLELEQIVCDSEFSQGLLAYVREDRERVERISG